MKVNFPVVKALQLLDFTAKPTSEIFINHQLNTVLHSSRQSFSILTHVTRAPDSCSQVLIGKDFISKIRGEANQLKLSSTVLGNSNNDSKKHQISVRCTNTTTSNVGDPNSVVKCLSQTARYKLHLSWQRYRFTKSDTNCLHYCTFLSHYTLC